MMNDLDSRCFFIVKHSVILAAEYHYIYTAFFKITRVVQLQCLRKANGCEQRKTNSYTESNESFFKNCNRLHAYCLNSFLFKSSSSLWKKEKLSQPPVKTIAQRNASCLYCATTSLISWQDL